MGSPLQDKTNSVNKAAVFNTLCNHVILNTE